jgi:N-acetylglucosamine-6-phosphate deacetylase
VPTRKARLVDTDRTVALTWSGTTIERIDDCPEGVTTTVSPGFVDIQINGFGGVNFGDPAITADQVVSVADRLAQEGVTHFLPTLITDDIERMKGALARLARAADDDRLGSGILGFHLEGPYISEKDGARGAHPLAHCKDPDWDEFCRLQDAAQGKIRLVTLAPERPGSTVFITRAVRSGVCVAIGHTSATRAEILSAVDAGATLATHLGNAAPDLIQRHYNTIFDQLGDDRLMASLIVDGHHLPPHVVKIFVRAKGPERVILVSDAVQYAGLPAGVYDGGYRQFEVRDDGFIGVVGEPRLAGSGLLLTRALENMSRYLGSAGVDPWIGCVTTNPRRLLSGVDDGPLTAGVPASMALWQWDETARRIIVVETIRDGRTLYKRSSS